MKRIANAMLCATATIAVHAQTFTTLDNFNYTDGAGPEAALVQATNGDFYGTTVEGGAYGAGTVFKVTPSGTLTTPYTFCAQKQLHGRRKSLRGAGPGHPMVTFTGQPLQGAPRTPGQSSKSPRVVP